MRSYHLDYNIVPADRLPEEDDAVIGYEFLVPWIAPVDNFIVNRTTERPYQVSEGGTAYEDITAPWPLGHSESNSKRFVEFTGPQDTSHLGEWQTDLVVNGKVLVSRRFTLFFEITGKYVRCAPTYSSAQWHFRIRALIR